MWPLPSIAIRAIAAAAILAALAWGYHLWADHQRDIGRNEVRAEWQADKLNIAEQNRLLLMARDRDTTKLQAQADKQRSADNAEKIALGRRVAGLVDSLRDRPERPADASGGSVSTVAGSGAAGRTDGGCTGARLFRSDSEFLAGQFANATRLQIALKACRADLASAIEAVNGTR